MALPKKNSLWSRKDSRRPGVVKVTRVDARGSGWLNDFVHWEDTSTGRTGTVLLEQWERRYRPYTAPLQVNAPADGAEGK